MTPWPHPRCAVNASPCHVPRAMQPSLPYKTSSDGPERFIKQAIALLGHDRPTADRDTAQGCTPAASGHKVTRLCGRHATMPTYTLWFKQLIVIFPKVRTTASRRQLPGFAPA